MRYFVHTFGCQMNKTDSERIESYLESLNYKRSDNIYNSDLVILNTCSVRQKAEDRVFGMLKNLNKAKHNNTNLKIGVTGCMVSRNIKKLNDKVDFTFKINEIPNLKFLLQHQEPIIINSDSGNNIEYFKINPKYSSKFHAYVPIMTGCNNFCSYCVVPYTRGREISRPSIEIIKEITHLLKSGYKAITLVGQNVNSYGNDLSDDINFPKLLNDVSSLPFDFWLWFVTSHPKDMSDALIETIALNDKICPYIHLAAQSGSDKILKAMNRGYTKKHYIGLVNKITDKIKDVSLSTDIIVGFPGETKDDFNETVDLFEKVKFDMAYIAQYSIRSGTAAAKLNDNVTRKEKISRDKILSKLLKNESLEFNRKFLGNTVDVLIECAENNNFVLGKTKTLKTVKVKLPDKTNSSKIIGQIKKVKIIQINDFGLEGEII